MLQPQGNYFTVTDLTPTSKGQARNVDMYGQGHKKTETGDGKWIDLLTRLGKKSKMRAVITVRQSRWIYVRESARLFLNFNFRPWSFS